MILVGLCRMEKSVFVKKPPCIIRHPQHYTENEGESAMTIAILAHDSRKELALQFCTAYSGILSRNTVIATGTTGRMLAQATGLPVHCYLSGRLGGVQQITSRVACDEVDLVLFFRDACAICTVCPLPPTLLLPRCCCAAWIRATWTTATGCTRKFWSPFPSTVPCAEKLRL